MARNLRAAIPKDDLLVVHDCRKEAAMKLREEMEKVGDIAIADSPGELAGKSVGWFICADLAFVNKPAVLWAFQTRWLLSNKLLHLCIHS